MAAVEIEALFGAKRYVSLENPQDREFAQTDPGRFLARFTEGAILDEVHRCRADGSAQPTERKCIAYNGGYNFQLLKETYAPATGTLQRRRY